MKSTNNIANILRDFNGDKNKFLNEAEEIGNRSINRETPVDTGNLIGKNDSVVLEDTVAFWNGVEYFPFVHFGTMFMSANPYMLRGLIQAKSDIAQSLVKNLRIQ